MFPVAGLDGNDEECRDYVEDYKINRTVGRCSGQREWVHNRSSILVLQNHPDQIAKFDIVCCYIK